MGYWMEQFDQHFTVLAANKQSAFDALKKWEDAQLKQRPYLANYPPLGNAENLEDALEELCWQADQNEQGNIIALYYFGEKIGDEDTWLELIAPYVEKGSYLMMRGEDGYNWCWYFDGSTCMDYPGEVVFPDMPADEENASSRKSCVVVLHYPESDWGDDYACFDVPADCALSQVLDEVEKQKTQVSPCEFDSMQDYAEAVCSKAADALNGSWRYMAQAGSIEVIADEDDEGV